MPSIWIDLDNSPHVHFFAPIIRDLAQRDIRTLLTVRDFSQTVDLATAYGLDFTVIGTHRTPRTTTTRIAATLERAGQLARHVLRHERPRAAISHGSRGLTISAAGMRIPVMTLFDYEFVSAKLFFMLSRRVLMPAVVARDLPQRRGLVGYPGLKEDVYIHDHEPDRRVLAELDLDPSKLIIVVRPPATWAHYHHEKSDALFRALVERLRAERDAQIVVLTRTAEQADHIRLEYALDDRFRLRFKAVDGLSLIWFSDAVFSGGGTMIRESAQMGVPSYSTFAGEFGGADRYLVEQGKLTMLRELADVERIIVRKRATIARLARISETRDFIVNQIMQLVAR